MSTAIKILLAAAAITVALAVGGTASASRSNQLSLPFSATDAGIGVIVGADVDAAGNPVFKTADSGTGQATHLGRFTLSATENVNVGTKTVTEGFYTLVAANGDTLTGTYRGDVLPDLTGYVVSGPITGGTGRFAGATGSLVWHGRLDPVTFIFSDVIDGVISLPRSHQSDDA
jgi:hypothetical protein